MKSAQTIRLDNAAMLADLGRQLGECLGQLHGLMRQLAENAAAKLAAMRRADAAALQALAAGEEDTLRQTAQVEQKRAAILAGMAQALQWPELRSASLGELAERLPEPAASQIRARNAGLRAVAENLKKNTRMVAAVARSLQSHVRAILDELAGAHLERLGYGAKGQEECSAARTWVDALG